MSGQNGSIKPGAGSWSYDPFQISVGYRLDFNMLTPHADPTQTRLPPTTPCYQSEIAFLILKFKRGGKLWKRAAQFLILQESLDYLLTNKKGLKLILYKLEGLAKGIYLSRSLARSLASTSSFTFPLLFFFEWFSLSLFCFFSFCSSTGMVRVLFSEFQFGDSALEIHLRGKYPLMFMVFLNPSLLDLSIIGWKYFFFGFLFPPVIWILEIFGVSFDLTRILAFINTNSLSCIVRIEFLRLL